MDLVHTLYLFIFPPGNAEFFIIRQWLPRRQTTAVSGKPLLIGRNGIVESQQYLADVSRKVEFRKDEPK